MGVCAVKCPCLAACDCLQSSGGSGDARAAFQTPGSDLLDAFEKQVCNG